MSQPNAIQLSTIPGLALGDVAPTKTFPANPLVGEAIDAGSGPPLPVATASFDIRTYGAVAGMTDATSAIQAALQAAKDYVTANTGEWAEVVVPRGLWNLASAGGLVFDTPRVRLRGFGGTIKKKVNGPVFTINYTAGAGEANVAAGVQLIDLVIDANYRGGFTGVTLTLANCYDFVFRGGLIIDGHVGSPLLLFTVAGQVRRRIQNNTFRVAGTPQNLGIFDTSIDNGGLPAPDFMFDGNDCCGSPIDARGCNNLYLRGNTCSNIITDAISNKLFAVGNRIATSGNDIVIYGSNHLFDDNLCNPGPGNIILGNGLSNSYIGENHAIGGSGSGFLIDRSGTTSNQVWGAPIKPSVTVYNGVNTTLTTGVFGVLAFNGEHSKKGGANLHDNATLNKRIWLRKKGDWLLGAAAEFAANVTGIRSLTLRLNGSVNGDLIYQQVSATPSSACRLAVNTMYPTNGPSDLTVDTTNGSPNLTNVAVAAYSPAPTVGQAIEGPGIPAGARIGSIAGTTYGLVDDNGAAVNATATAAAIAAVSTDYIEVRALQTSGGNLDITGGDKFYTNAAWARLL